MDADIEEIQKLLDSTARQCLRLIAKEELSHDQYKRLSKFIFGCMNQKNELPRRVKQRGSQELGKVLKFVEAAAVLLIEIEADRA